MQAMKIICGKPISPGYAQGHAVLFGVSQTQIARKNIPADQIEAEIARFKAALDTSHRELSRLQARVQSELGTDSAEIFSAHLLFLRDPQFIDKVAALIQRDGLSVEAAITATADELAHILDQSDNTYLRERAADVHDLKRRLMRHITSSDEEQLVQLEPDSILVARELLPSNLLEFDRDHLAGIITETGGETDHAAILARTLGIPSVTGITGAMRIISPDMSVLVDGQAGQVLLNPSPDSIHAVLASKDDYDQAIEHAIDAENRECATRDGTEVALFANMGRPFEHEAVKAHHLDGVGLFRTEYLYLDEPVAPSFERQYDIYREVAASLDGLPVVIRTLDLGGDKWPAFLKPRFEANPNLGVRGLRFSLLAAEELFRTQIRAALLAATDHDIRIMLPMVLGQADLKHAISVIQKVASEEGISRLPPVGALIETPSAVFAIDEILSASDFVSIGTNDLTQFMLAADRNALAMIDDYTVLHPSVLRAVHRVIDAANTAGKPAAICGEAASDPHVACLLVGLGARRLSMSPMSAAKVRYAVRESEISTLEDLAQTALRSDCAQSVSSLLTTTLGAISPEFRQNAISV